MLAALDAAEGVRPVATNFEIVESVPDKAEGFRTVATSF
jgi:hypothetical protein